MDDLVKLQVRRLRISTEMRRGLAPERVYNVQLSVTHQLFKRQVLPVHICAIQGATGNAFVPNYLFSLRMPNKYIELFKGIRMKNSLLDAEFLK